MDSGCFEAHIRERPLNGELLEGDRLVEHQTEHEILAETRWRRGQPEVVAEGRGAPGEQTWSSSVGEALFPGARLEDPQKGRSK